MWAAQPESLAPEALADAFAVDCSALAGAGAAEGADLARKQSANRGEALLREFADGALKGFRAEAGAAGAPPASADLPEGSPPAVAERFSDDGFKGAGEGVRSGGTLLSAEEDSPERGWWRSGSGGGGGGGGVPSAEDSPTGGWEEKFSDGADEAPPQVRGEAEPRAVAGGGGGRGEGGLPLGVFLPGAGETGASFQGGRDAAASVTGLPKEFEIPVQELTFNRRIGKGAFGDVLQATWQGTDVAVKVLNPGQVSEKSVEDFRREVGMLLVLRHPNVVLFMGAATVAPDLCIVMEHAARGSLYRVLHQRDRQAGIDHARRIQWATEIARGMNYLHTRSPPIVHRDLKSSNILVDADSHVKVSDFGLARTKARSFVNTQVGTWAWMAPEVLENAPYTELADVYSFGIVLHEMLTGQEPFKGMHPMQVARAVVDKKERPLVPAGIVGAQGYVELMVACWDHEPVRRPSFSEILTRLSGIPR